MAAELENKKSGFISRLFKGPKPKKGEENNSSSESDGTQLSPNTNATHSLANNLEAESVNESLAKSAEGETTEVDGTSVATQKEQEKSKSSNSWLSRLHSGLLRSSSAISQGISEIVSKRKLNEEMVEDLADILIRADLGLDTASAVTDSLTKSRFNKEISDEEIKGVLANEVESVLSPVAIPLEIDAKQRPYVILVVGVNGTGKTTTIGKLASKFRSEGKVVNLVAGDTFRAAAVEQLKIWGQRTESHVFAKDEGGDAAGLVFDSMKNAVEKEADVLLIDTAGRLQNKADLMEELKKIIRVIKKHNNDAPHSVLLTLDATTGQNALSQVEIFSGVAGVNGLVMTKLDGTARGGILVAIARKFNIPVHFIGVGEKIEDLETFSARDFARAIAGLSE